MDKNREVLARTGRMLLTYSPALLAMLVILSARGPLTRWHLALSAFLVGCVGVVIALRRESPMSLGSIRGKWAVVQGVGLTGLCWVAALCFLLL